MRFSAATLTLLTATGSLASAFHQTLNARDMALLDSAFSVMKREAYGSAYNDAMEHILSARYLEDDEFDTLGSRSPFSDFADEYNFYARGKDPTVTEYLQHVKIDLVNPGNGAHGEFGKDKWLWVHGDNKSQTNGVYGMMIGTFGGKKKGDPIRHQAKITGRNDATMKAVKLKLDTVPCAVAVLKQEYEMGTAPVEC